jgi:two-component system phosphate regulon response regulator PhoB
MTRTNHVVVVDHDLDTRRLIDDLLAEDGFRVTSLADGEALLALLREQRPDLVILELQLPGIRGTEILRRLQAETRVPAIVVSTKGSETDRIVGLEMGADDYLPKPFSPRELLARAHAVLRRTEHVCPCDTLEYDGFKMDLTCRDVIVDGDPVELTSLEFDLLAFLASFPRQVFSRETLLDRVWGSSQEWQTPATVSEHIHRLRRKIESDSSQPHRIQTMRGAGYRFVP